MRNAISSGTRNPRFSPVRKGDLEALIYSVDVHSLAELISDASTHVSKNQVKNSSYERDVSYTLRT